MRAGVKYGTRGKREEWGNKWGGGDKGGVKVPVYTAGGVRFQHTLQQSALQFQSRTKVEKDTDCVLIGE